MAASQSTRQHAAAFASSAPKTAITAEAPGAQAGLKRKHAESGWSEAAGPAKQQRQQHHHQQWQQRHHQQQQHQQQQGDIRQTDGTQQQQGVLVPACSFDCQHTLTHGWCHSEVQLPVADWRGVVEANMQHVHSDRVAHGYERLHMPAGIQLLVVEQAAHVAAALAQLRSSMQDAFVAIDLEWRPDFGKGRSSPVAMVQLATSRLAVLIRTCRMGYRLPQPLRDFMADPKVHLLGFSWACADEGKMRSTFGVGMTDFGRFMDLQQVAQGLGYHNFGLARLSQHVLGVTMPKNKKISMSNWEMMALTRNQLKYAALDALVAGQVFRALRLWHSKPSRCETCQGGLGVVSTQGAIACSGCDKSCRNIKGYMDHCKSSGHTADWAECEACGLTRQLPWPVKA